MPGPSAGGAAGHSPGFSSRRQPALHRLSRREREIVNILYELGSAGAHEVVERMSDDLSYDTVRVTLSILEKKGYLVHHREGRRYIYTPRTSREKASRSAMQNLLRTFFDNSPSKAILTMLDVSGERLNEEELERISRLIEEERET